ncbi:VanZ family protein [Ornithinimicrobium sp. INDO-MA30-4]|uniref:VanZ family protein n=1 Tax=Ornithinimicrobium sp. INDO-MA30-4 TaxID=2908651 RepID=UPI001F371415|nr:VanZ family protein [Ornithinimicrobium sp. INDO-MA30-4]UJH70784.1 VanZ family protein [Ornithinimicrobium sp. INDO-MA30-4]
MTQRHLLDSSQRAAVGYVCFGALLLLQVQLLYLATGTGPPPFAHADKVVHFLMFALPAAVAAVVRSRAMIVVLIVHAVISEPAQRVLTSGRQMDVWDAVADLLGVALGVAAIALIRARVKVGQR